MQYKHNRNGFRSKGTTWDFESIKYKYKTMKKLQIFLALVLFIAFAVSGCEEKGQQLSVEDKSVKSNEVIPKNSSLKNTDQSGVQNEISGNEDKIPDSQKRMIIKTGSMNLEADKYDESETRINEVVKANGGYISLSRSSINAQGIKSGTITVKVPADKFDFAVNEVSKIGKVTNQNINTNDVTEEYVDLESRLNTQKELEKRLLSLLNDKAVKLSDVIEVEEKLASVRQKIEGIEGKLKLLKSQSDMSTLTINISEPSLLGTSSGEGFFHDIGQAFKKGLTGFTNVLSVLITLLIAIIPIAVIVYIAYRIVKSAIKRRKQK